MCVRQIVTVDRKKLTLQRSKNKTDVPVGIYEQQMTMEDWGLYKTYLSAFISAVVQLPIHTVFTCLEQFKEDKITGEMLRIPALSGKLATECPKYFDIVCHMENTKDDAGNDLRVWRTANDGRTIAKDSTGRLDAFEETDWHKLITKALGTNGKVKK